MKKWDTVGRLRTGASGALVLWLLSGAAAAAETDLTSLPARADGPAPLAPTEPWCGITPAILWQRTNGHVAIFHICEGAVASERYLTVDPSWRFQGAADFNFDGVADVVWRQANGDLAIWYLDWKGDVIDQRLPGTKEPASEWTIQGLGDFDADTRADILWRRANGQLAIWFKGESAGEALPGYHNVPGPVDNSWRVEGVGLFSPNSTADILWRHTSGQVAIWHMNGGTMVGESYPGGANPSLGFEAVGTFSGFLSDILWRNAAGRLELWLDGDATNVEHPSYQNQGQPVHFDWQVEGVADFDGDGEGDILWRHTGGQLAIWLTIFGIFAGETYPAGLDTSWKIQGVLKNSQIIF